MTLRCALCVRDHYRTTPWERMNDAEVAVYMPPQAVSVRDGLAVCAGHLLAWVDDTATTDERRVAW